MAARKFFTIRFILTTLIAIAAVVVLIRLGFWQLDRLAWRRAFNERVVAQINRPMLDLNSEIPVGSLYDMEYRWVKVDGTFDDTQQILLRNQVWESQNGYHLLTPLIMEGSPYAILVDRGWVPFDDAADLKKYSLRDQVHITGRIRRPQSQPDFGGVPDPTLQPGQQRLEAVNIINLDRIQEQVNMPLLPVYIQQAPVAEQLAPPYASLTEVEITEGPHMGYALQWFAFAAILAVGFPFFIYRQVSKKDDFIHSEKHQEVSLQGEAK